MKLVQRLLGLLSVIILTSTMLNGSQIHARGATFPKIVYEDWIKAYEEQTGKHISYKATGSGDGVVSIVRRKCDFSGSDKPLRPWRLKRYKLTMFPVLIGSIVLAYNLPGIEDGALRLSEEAIAAIFSGEIQYWDDPRITSTNKSLMLPHKPISVAVRADGSGTTYNFTYYLRKIDYAHFRKAAKSFDWKAETISAKGSSRLSKLITATPYSIGYVDYSKKLKYDLSTAVIQNKSGNWVSPTLKAAQEGAKRAHLDKNKDFYGVIAYQDGKDAYPLIATTFVLLPYEGKAQNREILDFFNWAFEHGQALANTHGFSMLPKETIQEIRAYWREKVLQPPK
jgi:phosphate transport system substrate-binding protein